jgi:hypothetical protein
MFKEFDEGTQQKFDRIIDGIVDLSNDWTGIETTEVTETIDNLIDMLIFLRKDFNV